MSSSAKTEPEPTAAAQPPAGQSGTQTLIRGLRVVESLAAHDQPIGVGELSRQLGLPKSTVQRLLRTLEQERWAETSSDPVTRWRLSQRLVAVVRRGVPSRSLSDVAAPYLAELGERTGETIHFCVPDGAARLVLIQRIDSVHPVRTFNQIGAVTDGLHTTASGKAYLAMLPSSEVDEILARPLPKITGNTVVDARQLLHQVLEARERGYGVNISENRAHVCAIGAAVAGPSGRPVAAVAISMPDSRFVPARVPEWGALVRQTAQSISDALVDGPSG